MQRVFFFLLLLVFTFKLSAEEAWKQPALPLADVIGAPSAFAGNVNVITGSYCEQDVDLVVDGPTPLTWMRTYNSTSFNHLQRAMGWYDNHPCYAYSNRPEGWKIRWCTYQVFRADGAQQTFRTKKTQLSGPWFDGNTRGFTNLGETISGRSNFKNAQSIAGSKWKTFKVHQENGEIRKYLQGRNIQEFYLKWVTYPNGNVFEYDTQDKRNPNSIKALKANGDAWAELSIKPGRDVIELHDGRSVHYKWIGLTSLKGPSKFLLHHVDRLAGPPIWYDYMKMDKRINPVLVAKRGPEGRILSTEYYKWGNNPIAGQVIHCTKEDMRIGRVRGQFAPAGVNGQMIPIRRFLYHLFHNSKRGWTSGKTDVLDPYGNIRQYHFGKDERLSQIIHMDNHRNLYLQEFMEWGREEETLGNIMRYSVQDRSKNILKQFDYTYDSAGNVLTHGLFHAVDGNDPKNLQEDLVSYTYYTDNLLKTESHPNGLNVWYYYKPNTNLLTIKLVGDGEKVLQREFYDYNADAVMVRHEVDNGCGRRRDDKTGVTMCRYTHITPNSNIAGYGKPETVEERYIENGEDHLICRREFTYDQYGYKKKEKLYDADGKHCFTSHFEHDSYGRLVEQTDPYGATTRYHYDANWNVTLVEGPRPGMETARQYDLMNRMVAETTRYDGQEWTTHHEYEPLGKKTGTTDIHGNTSRFSYDAAGNVIQVDHPAQPRHGELVTPTEFAKYDPLNNQIYHRDPEGHVETASYNGRDKPLTKTNVNGTEEVFTYNTHGDLIKCRQQDGTYKECTYDALGRVLSEKHLDYNGELISEVTTTYDGYNKLTTTDAAGNTTRFEYDGAGRLIAQHSPTTTIRYAYDKIGRQHKTIYSDRVEVEEKDYLDRVIETRVEDLDGKVWKRAEVRYDEVGNKIATITHGAHGEEMTTMTYDGLNRVLSVTDPFGNTSTTSYHDHYLNAWGQTVLLITQTDPLGRTIITEHDARGQVFNIERFDEEGTQTASDSAEYDLNGNRVLNTHQVIADGVPIRTYEIVWKYGPAKQLLEIIDNHLRTTRHTYDSFGRMKSTILPDGNIIHRIYDLAGRLFEHYADDGTIFHRYTYDERGLVIRIDDLVNNTHTIRTYDADRRIIEEKLANGQVMMQEYNGSGLISAVTLAGERIEYQYTPVGQEKISWRQKTYGYLERDFSGRILRTSSTRYTYDRVGRFDSIESDHYTFLSNSGYDSVGRLESYFEQYDNRAIHGTYDYDPLDQLIEEHGWTNHTYRHDSLNTRLNIDERTEEVDDLNQLVSDDREEYLYDEVGRRIAKVNEDVHYSYDALGRLTRATFGDSREIEFTYDPFHRCMTKTVITAETQTTDNFLYWDKCEVGMVRDNVLRQLRILGEGRGAEIGAAVFIFWNGTEYDVVHDFRGNVIGLLSENTLQHIQRYSAFGETTEKSTLPWGFSSKRNEYELNLVNFSRRYYCPSTARWITPDPAGYADGPNLYAYVKNTPISSVDLWGLWKLSFYPTTADRCLYDCARTSAPQCSITDSDERIREVATVRSACGRPYYWKVGTPKPNCMPTFVQLGINETHESSVKKLNTVSEALNGSGVVGVIMTTRGFLPDIVLAMMSKFHWPTESATMLRQGIFDIDQKNGGTGMFHMIAHSRGTSFALDALGGLPQQILNRAWLTSVGGCEWTPPWAASDVENYVTPPDPVPTTQTIGRHGFEHRRAMGINPLDPMYAPTVLQPLGPGWQHGFLEATYRKAWEFRAKEFAKTYNSQNE